MISLSKLLQFLLRLHSVTAPWNVDNIGVAYKIWVDVQQFSTDLTSPFILQNHGVLYSINDVNYLYLPKLEYRIFITENA